jgi:D-arabinose 1-dehydrogenase-like Zn-dependent alcohol dehydrogenase
MHAVQSSRPGTDWELVDREIPEPGPGQVRIKVEACGICHSDMFVKEGLWPGLQYPRIPGHEVAGRIDKVGSAVTAWKKGQRVGVGWHGGHCGQCESCRRGDFLMCRAAKICGFSYDGGWAEYLVVPAEAVASLPDGLPAEEAAPLLCAGITTFNSLRNSGARAGDLVAVQGVGGLGHLGIQYASKMRFATVAVGRGKDKEPLARQLGAVHYIDAAAVNAAEELQRLGGARVILATAPDGKGISSLVDGLGINGTLLVVAAPGDPIAVNVVTLIMKRASVQGWPSGTATDSEDTLRFSALAGVRPMIERYPLARASEAYQQMISGKARFRAVLTFSPEGSAR